MNNKTEIIIGPGNADMLVMGGSDEDSEGNNGRPTLRTTVDN